MFQNVGMISGRFLKTENNLCSQAVVTRIEVMMQEALASLWLHNKTPASSLRRDCFDYRIIRSVQGRGMVRGYRPRLQFSGVADPGYNFQASCA